MTWYYTISFEDASAEEKLAAVKARREGATP